MKVLFFDERLENFVQKLEAPILAKVLRTIDLLERYGPVLRMPHSKKIDDKMFELRIRGQQEIRIFYVFHGQAAILLHGFIKKSWHIPQKELRVARRNSDLFDGL